MIFCIIISFFRFIIFLSTKCSIGFNNSSFVSIIFSFSIRIGLFFG